LSRLGKWYPDRPFSVKLGLWVSRSPRFCQCLFSPVRNPDSVSRPERFAFFLWFFCVRMAMEFLTTSVLATHTEPHRGAINSNTDPFFDRPFSGAPLSTHPTLADCISLNSRPSGGPGILSAPLPEHFSVLPLPSESDGTLQLADSANSEAYRSHPFILFVPSLLPKFPAPKDSGPAFFDFSPYKPPFRGFFRPPDSQGPLPIFIFPNNPLCVFSVFIL